MAEQKQSHEQRKADAKKVLDKQREETDEANAKAMERMDNSRPTPTQEENDLAKLGVAVDEKEDDGSGETVIEKRIVANQPLGYETRSERARRREGESGT